MPDRLLVLAPNWLGDAVMALPALAAARCHIGSGGRLTVAARPPVAPLFSMVPGVDAVVALEAGAGLSGVRRWRRDAVRIAAGGYAAALLLPNSFVSAWIAAQARVPERWGYAADWRAPLLTRAVPRPRAPLHQADYYLALAEALGMPRVERVARVVPPETAGGEAAAQLAEAGLPAGTPYAVLAPGAAYGRAKQWPPERFAELSALLWARHGLRAVLVGTRGDAGACAAVVRAAAHLGGGIPVDLAGRTSLPVLAAVLAGARVVVSNDSGAMHLAAATGAAVVGVFGPTDEMTTHPIVATAGQPLPRVVTHPVWCRPCMLRECPIDHRCMRGLTAAAVAAAAAAALEATGRQPEA